MPDAMTKSTVLKAIRAGEGVALKVADLRNVLLHNENLAGANLSRCDLSGVDLSGANLKGANLSFCNLEGATLFKADLTGAELLSANLKGANLSEAVTTQAGFGGATLAGAALFSTDLTGATLTKANLAGADFRAAVLAGARMRQCDMTGAHFVKAVMAGADLEESDVTRGEFTDADLRGAHFKRIRGYETAVWIGADIRDVDFCGAYMVRRHIMDENYLYEFRTANRLNAAVYRIWWATSDCGRSFGRFGLWCVGAALLFAVCFRFVDMSYGIHDDSFLSALYYSVVTMTTLGYGDVLPASGVAKWLAIAEVCTGYVALGGLMSIFANKMARRAE